MQIIRREDLVATPWKNGGGITHEIARVSDGDGLLWRLSVAEVFESTIHPPLFPISVSQFPGDFRFHDVSDEEFDLGPVQKVVGGGAFAEDQPVAPLACCGAGSGSSARMRASR